MNSLVIPEGEVVTLFENADRDKGGKSVRLWQGTYSDIGFYLGNHRWPIGNPGLVFVEKTGVDPLSLVEFGWMQRWDDNPKHLYPVVMKVAPATTSPVPTSSATR